MSALIEQCYKKSVELLTKNSTKHGFLAATPKGKANSPLIHYNWIFGRDSSICSMGGVASGSQKLIKTAKNTLVTLAKHQTKQGQIPNALSEKEKKTEYYFLSSVDGTLWWLIALNFYNQYSGDKKLYKKLKPKANKAIHWLDCQTSGTSNLIEQAEASDWADLMPRSGHVLYSNVLWYWTQKLYKLKGAQLTKSGINSFFYPFGSTKTLFYKKNFLYARLRKDINRKMKPTDYYLSYIKTFSAGKHCNVYANILALMLGLPNKKLKNKTLNYLLKYKVNEPYPIQVLTPPIKTGEDEWGEVMMRNNKNKPYYYHNGGIWPYVGSFWIIMLKKLGRKKLALSELEKLAKANKINNWEFNEWFNGKTGIPGGIKGQSWNAGTYILAYHFIKGDIKI